MLHTRGFQWDLSIDNVTQMACRTGLVHKEEIQISQLSGSRYLIILPEAMHPETFINATPQDLWDEGFSFQQWHPMEGASISIPAYKVLLRLVGLPPHLHREKHVRTAVARFGVFLGSVEPEDPASLASWLVAVGVDDLTLVPPQLVLHIGGAVHYVQTYAEAWHRAPIYTAEDMPKHPPIYKRPQPPPSSSSSSETGTMKDDSELIPMSAQVLREMCRGRTADSLPPELRQFASLEEIDMQDPHNSTLEGAAFNPDKDNQATLNITQNQPQSFQRPADPLRSPSGVHNRVAGISMAPPTFPKKSHHTGSTVKDAIPAIPQRTVRGSHLIQQHGVANEGRHTTDPTQQTQRRITPFRILQRGESSAPPANQISMALNSRPILPCQTDNSKGGSAENQGTTFEAAPILLDHAHNPRRIQLGRNRSLALGPTKGPLSSKYVWRKPNVKKNPVIQTQRKGKETGQPKRKGSLHTAAGPAKRPNGKGKEKEQAQVSFNPEGFYEVKVSYEHVSRLAEGCGFQAREVEAAIQLDNEQRRANSKEHTTNQTLNNEGEPELDMGRFDPDSNDELSSEEEA